MFDQKTLPIIKPLLEKCVDFLVRIGANANTLTVIGFIFGMMACLMLYLGLPLVGLVFFLVNRVMDGLDGALARRKGMNDFGAFLDILLDFIVYSAIPFTFALRNPADAQAAAFLIFSFIGTGSSFLAFAIFAVKAEMKENVPHLKKSFLYLGGLVEGTETLVALSLCFVFPGWFFWIALVFGALCWLTTAQRIYYAYKIYA